MADASKTAPRAAAPWPDLTEYHEAVQHPQRAFDDTGLKVATIESDRFGMPKPATGGNAVVYKALENGETWAIRCFLRPISDHAERYAAISRHLVKHKLAYSVPFLFLQDGIRVRGGWFPAIKMKWAAGDLLHNYLERNLEQPKALAALRKRWLGLTRDLERAKIAHGDLQHGNVLVKNDELVLIDYDGMWVPSLAGRDATELGHRAYQHPKRRQSDFGPHIDRFSALVVYLSILALESDPGLWELFHTGDNLIFVREDFRAAGKTAVWDGLACIASDEVRHLAATLATCAERRPVDVPALESVLDRSIRIKLKALPPPARATAAAKAPGANLPSWMSSSALSALPIIDVAPQWKDVWSRPGERLERRWKKSAGSAAPAEPGAPAPAAAPGPAPAAPRRARRALAPGARLALAIGGALLGVAVAWKLSAIAGVAVGAAACGGAIAWRRGRGDSDRDDGDGDDDDDDDASGGQREEVRVEVAGMTGKLAALACTANGNLAVIAATGECGVWDVAADAFRPAQARLPGFELAALAHHAPRAIIADDNGAAVWDIARWLKTPCPVDAQSKVYAVAISGDGSRVALGYASGLISVVDTAARKVVGELRGHGGPISAVALSDDAHFLVFGTAAGTVQLARVQPRPAPIADGFIHTSRVTAVAAAPRGKLFASADGHGTVALWSAEMQRQFAVPVGRAGVSSLCFLGDRDLALAAGCNDGTIKIISVGSGRPVASFVLGPAAVTALAFVKTRPGLAAGTADGRVAVFAVS